MEPTPLFIAGKKYLLRTQTVQVTRTSHKPNSFTGELEELEFTGQELAIFLTAEDGNEYAFMDGKLRDGKTKVAEARQQKASRRMQRFQREPEAIPIDFSLQQLTEHFIIPEVPDVATNNPDVYHANLQTLEKIEELCNAF